MADEVKGFKPAFDVYRSGPNHANIRMNRELANLILDIFEDRLKTVGALPKEVYAFGERLCKVVEPGAYFGVKRDAA